MSLIILNLELQKPLSSILSILLLMTFFIRCEGSVIILFVNLLMFWYAICN